MGAGARAWDREGGGEILDHRGVRCWLLAAGLYLGRAGVEMCIFVLIRCLCECRDLGDTVGPGDTLHGTMATFRHSSQLQLALTWL